jgi:hypothetical protein
MSNSNYRFKAVWYLPRKEGEKRRTTTPKSLKEISRENLTGHIAMLDGEKFMGFAKLNRTNLNRVRNLPGGDLLWALHQDIKTQLKFCSSKPIDLDQRFSMPKREGSHEAKLIAEAKASLQHYGFIVDDARLYNEEGRGGPVQCRKRRT